MKRTKWFDRKFPIMEDNGALPSIIERLAGTPARVEEIVRNTNASILKIKPDGKWSIKEHIGHLGDLETLWLGRMDDFEKELPELRAADLTNQKTHTANHNATEIKTLLQRLREHQMQFVNRLRNLSEEQLMLRAMHPRLKTPMRIIDHAYFVAEHDDHHLVSMRQIISTSPEAVKKKEGGHNEISIENAMELLRKSGRPFTEVFAHGTLSVELYKPQGADKQTPHTRDEIYVVASGKGEFINDGRKWNFKPGDFLFVPAGKEHRFVNFSDDFATWVFFYGPEGGEYEVAEN